MQCNEFIFHLREPALLRLLPENSKLNVAHTRAPCV